MVGNNIQIFKSPRTMPQDALYLVAAENISATFCANVVVCSSFQDRWPFQHNLTGQDTFERLSLFLVNLETNIRFIELGQCELLLCAFSGQLVSWKYFKLILKIFCCGVSYVVLQELILRSICHGIICIMVWFVVS